MTRLEERKVVMLSEKTSFCDCLTRSLRPLTRRNGNVIAKF